MGGELYRYTLEEYNDMIREYEDLDALDNQMADMRNEAFGPANNAYEDALRTLRNRLQHVNSSYGWQGDDAESYKNTAREIANDFDRAIGDYEAALAKISEKVRARRSALVSAIIDCEQNGCLAPGDNLTVQAMLAAQDIVAWFEDVEEIVHE